MTVGWVLDHPCQERGVGDGELVGVFAEHILRGGFYAVAGFAAETNAR